MPGRRHPSARGESLVAAPEQGGGTLLNGTAGRASYRRVGGSANPPGQPGGRRQRIVTAGSIGYPFGPAGPKSDNKC